MTSLKKLKHHLTAAKEYFEEHCNFDCVCRAEYSSACNQGGAVCGYIADALEMIDYAGINQAALCKNLHVKSLRPRAQSTA